MRLEVPQDEEMLDEIVEHCLREFGIPDDTPAIWYEFLDLLTYPSLTDCALLLMDEDSLAGFAIYNTLQNYGKTGSGGIFQQMSMHFHLGQAATAGKNPNPVTLYFLKQHAIAQIEKNDSSITLEGYPNSLADISKDDAYLSQLLVLDEYRGQGLGTGIVSGLCAMLESQGIKRIFSHASNPASLRVHEKAGFEKIAYIHPHYSDGGETTFMGHNLKGESDE